MHTIRALRRLAFFLLLFPIVGAASNGAFAAPSSYALQSENSVVGFETDFGPDRITGQMPVARADLTLDFANAARSTIAVTLDARHAKASFPFAAQAMRGPKVLDTDRHPLITFQSTDMRANEAGARVEGNLTIRNITRPVVLQARISRPQGSDANDLGHLTVRLTGSVIRSDYGALGWLDMVGDEVRLDIIARIVRVN